MGRFSSFSAIAVGLVELLGNDGSLCSLLEHERVGVHARSHEPEASSGGRDARGELLIQV